MATERQYKSAKRMGTGLPLVLDDTLDTTVVVLTDSTTGTAADEVTPITFNATWSQAQADEIDSNMASLTVKVNEILTLLTAASLRD